MSDNELKELWQSGTQKNALDTTVLLERTMHEQEQLTRTISKRNRLEIVTAIMLIPAFGVMAVFIPPLLSKIGAALLIPACLFIIYKLKQTKKYLPVADNAVTVSAYLSQYRNYVLAEMKLLNTVLFWYLLPLVLPMILIFIGMDHYRFALGAIVLLVVVYAINKYAVKHEFLPKLARIDKDIDELAAGSM